jgi:hypothetical protein
MKLVFDGVMFAKARARLGRDYPICDPLFRLMERNVDDLATDGVSGTVMHFPQTVFTAPTVTKRHDTDSHPS